MLKLDWNIIFNIVNIIVLYLLMKKFLFGPITAIMEKRTETISSSLAEAEKKNNEAVQIKKNYEKSLANAEEKASEILREARQRAQEERDKNIKETKEEISKMMEEANKTIELERKKSMQNIQSDIAALAMTAASKVIQKNVDDESNNRVIDDFLEEVGVRR